MCVVIHLDFLSWQTSAGKTYEQLVVFFSRNHHFHIKFFSAQFRARNQFHLSIQLEFMKYVNYTLYNM